MIAIPAGLMLRPWRTAHGVSWMSFWRGPQRARPLRQHLTAVVLLALAPGILATLTVGFLADKALEDSRRARMADVAHSLADAVDREFERTLSVLSTLAASPGADGTAIGRPANRVRMASELIGVKIVLRRLQSPGLQTPGLQTQGLQSPSLEISGDAAPVDAVDRSVLAAGVAVLASGRPFISDVMRAPHGMPPATLVAVPVLRQGVTVATIEALLPEDRLIATLRRYHYQPGGFAVLVDGQGRVAASTRDVARLAGQLYLPPDRSGLAPGEMPHADAADIETPAAQMRSPRNANTALLSQAVFTVSSALSLPAGWRVFYSADRYDQDDLRQNLGTLGIVCIVIAACFVGVVTFLVGAMLSRKLGELTELARDVATGRTQADASLRHSGIREFEDLRQGMVRADAVLRRRAAAERIALREARTGHELLVSVVNGTAEWIHVKDLELRYVLVNRAGRDAGPQAFAEWQVLGRAAVDLFPPEVAQRIDVADRLVLATGRTSGFEQPYTDRASGRTLWVSMTVAPWKDATGRIVGIVSVSRDITEQRLADTRLRALQADLLRVTRLSAMGAMASGLAHELNQPLAAATNYLNAGGRLLDRAAHGDSEVLPLARGAVGDAAQQMLRAGAIVRRLRDFVERGEVELQLASVADLLSEACDLAQSDGIAAGITLRQGPAPSERILVDRTQIQQVLLNLIRNAAEAILSADPASGFEFGDELKAGEGEGEGEGTVEGVTAVAGCGEVVVHGHLGPDGTVLIDVRDNGPGLSPGIAERLFQPFVSSKQSGMGIGLAICRTIIEGHGGSLTAQRNADRGMLFRISLPALVSKA